MSIAPAFITVQRARQLGLRLRQTPIAGRYLANVPGTNIIYNVYDPRYWQRSGYGLRRRMWMLDGLGQEADPRPNPTWVPYVALGTVVVGLALAVTMTPEGWAR